MKSKTVFPKPGLPRGDLVANGEAEIGVGTVQGLIAIAGIEIVGPLPGDLQDTLVFVAAIMASAKTDRGRKVADRFPAHAGGSGGDQGEGHGARDSVTVLWPNLLLPDARPTWPRTGERHVLSDRFPMVAKAAMGGKRQFEFLRKLPLGIGWCSTGHFWGPAT